MAHRSRRPMVVAGLLVLSLALLGFFACRGKEGANFALGPRGTTLLRERVVFPWVFWPVREGEAAYCWEDGSPAACGSYLHDKPNGVWTYWWPDKSVRARGAFQEGSQVGLWLLCDEEGREVPAQAGSFEGGRERQIASWPVGAPSPNVIASAEYKSGKKVRALTPQEADRLRRDAAEAMYSCTCDDR